MKTVRRIFLTLFLSFLCLCPLRAQTFSDEVLNFTISGTTATVTGFAATVLPTVTIPATVTYEGTSYPVTAIGNNAFLQNVALTSVTFPAGLTTIGDNAFRGCVDLASVTLPTGLTTIGANAFLACYVLASVTFPAGLTTIGSEAFRACTGLSSVTLPAELTTIGNEAFSGCSGLTSITLQTETLPSLGEGVFTGVADGCVFSCPEGTRSAYWQNEAWRPYFPDPAYNFTFTSNGGAATVTGFAAGVAITALVILDTVIHEGVFYPVMAIGNSAFNNCADLTSVTFPAGLTSIGDGAFAGCSGLSSVTFPTELTSIGDNAFSGCSGLMSVIFQAETPPSLGEGAFSDVPAGCAFTCPEGKRNAYYHSLWQPYFADPAYDFTVTANDVDVTVTGLTKAGITTLVILDTVMFEGVYYPVTSIGDNAFADCRGLSSVTFPSTLAAIGTSAFNGCSGLTSVVFPSTLASVGDYAFAGCSGLSSLTIPSTLTSVGNYAFSGCNGLTSLSFPADMMAIGTGVFSDCSSLTGTLTLPTGLTAVGDYAFQGCYGLAAVSFPTGLTSIGGGAFDGCSGLTSVTLRAETPPSLSEGAFTGIPSDCAFSCPEGRRNAYYHSSWQPYFPDPAYDFTVTAGAGGAAVTVTGLSKEGITALVILDTVMFEGVYYPVTSIGDNAFNNCAGLSSVTFSTGLTSIGYEAFNGCSSLAGGLSFPTGLTSIGAGVFRDCISLSSLTFPVGLSSIDDYAFSGCSGLTSVTFPSSLTEIGASAFNGCGGLTSLTFPAGLTSIGAGTFAGCSGLSSVILQAETPSSLGAGAFTGVASDCSFTCPEGRRNAYYHSSWQPYFDDPAYDFMVTADDDGAAVTGLAKAGITALVIPDTVMFEGVYYPVTSIGDNAFNGRSGLSSVAFPAGLTSVGDYAFNGCDGLSSLTIPSTLTSVGDYAFSGCSRLTSLTLPASLTSIGTGVFSGCSGLKDTLTLPTNLTAVGDYAFQECYGLVALAFPTGLTTIGANAFDGCSGLTSVTLQAETPPLLGEGAFAGVADGCAFTCPEGRRSAYYHSLWQPYFADPAYDFTVTASDGGVTVIGLAKAGITALVILDTVMFEGIYYPVTSISANAFDNCASLTSLSLPSILTSIGDNAFSGCIGLSTVSFPAGITSVGDYAFADCIGLSSLTIPSTLTSVGDYAFAGCNGLTSLSLPTTMASVGTGVFSGCSGLTGTLTLPSGLTSIGDEAFAGCSGLSSLAFPTSLTTIGVDAFSDCSDLTAVTFPPSLTTIGDNAFADCSGLTSVTLQSETPPTLGEESFTGVSADCAFSCPEGRRNAYWQSTAWCPYFPDPAYDFTVTASDGGVTVTSLSAGMAITTLVILDSVMFEGIYYPVTSISANAFDNCTGLASVSFPTTLASIGDNAFSGCSGLTSVTFPAGLTSIGGGAFNNCTSLTSLTLPSTQTLVGDYAFAGCSGLTSLSLPATMTSIGTGVFSGCSGLTGTLTLPTSLTSVGDEAFSGCSGLSSLSFPASLTTIGANAFASCSGLTSVTLQTETPPSLGTDAFANVANGCAFSCPEGRRNAYWQSTAWRPYFPDPTYDFTVIAGDGGAAVTGLSAGVGITALVIPDNVMFEGIYYPVTSIEANAFDNCANLTSLTISSTLTSIGTNAFAGCIGLSSLTLPSTLTSLGDYAFSGCIGLSSLTLPTSMTSIGTGVFSGCSGLTSLSFPTTLTSIGDNAFADCSELTSVTLQSETPPSLGTDAFANVADGCAFTCPEGRRNAYWQSTAWRPYFPDPAYDFTVTTCDSGAAVTVTSLAKVGITALVIPDNVMFEGIYYPVTSIGDNAFSDCIGLSTVAFPAGITSVGANAFNGCIGLTSLTIPSTITSVGDYAFSGCSGLTSLSLPATMTSIGTGVFSGCSGLSSLEFPTGLTSIGNEAFADCNELISLILPASLTTIGANAFAGCSGLTSVILQAETPPSLGEEAVANVADGCTFICPEGRRNSYWQSTAWRPYFPDPAYDFTFTSSSGTITVTGLSAGVAITTLVIPDTVMFEGVYYPVTSISDKAFANCSGLTSVTFPTGLTSIGGGAFDGCSELASVAFQSETPPTLGEGAFTGVADGCAFSCPDGSRNAYYQDEAWCPYFPDPAYDFTVIVGDGSVTVTGLSAGVAITALVIPDSVMFEGVYYPVTSISDKAFAGCSGLTSLTLPASLTSIGDNAFAGCSGLTSVTLRPAMPPTLGEGAFAGISTGCAFTCPSQSLERYRASAWDPYFTVEREPEPGTGGGSGSGNDSGGAARLRVTFRQGDDVLYQTTVSRGGMIPADIVPILEEREGYTLCWFEVPDSSAIRNFSTPVTTDLTLSPVWIPNETPDEPSLSVLPASPAAPVEAALYSLRGQLLRRATVTLPTTPLALRTAFDVPIGIYILASPTGAQKVKL